MTAAPPAPKQLVEMLSSTSPVASLHANPSSNAFNASRGSLPWERLRYLRPRVVAKNCLKVGGMSPLDFLAQNGFLARFRWDRWVVQPLTKAPNSSSLGTSVDERSRMETTLGWARKLTRLVTSSFRQLPARFR